MGLNRSRQRPQHESDQSGVFAGGRMGEASVPNRLHGGFDDRPKPVRALQGCQHGAVRGEGVGQDEVGSGLQ